MSWSFAKTVILNQFNISFDRLKNRLLDSGMLLGVCLCCVKKKYTSNTRFFWIIINKCWTTIMSLYCSYLLMLLLLIVNRLISFNVYFWWVFSTDFRDETVTSDAFKKYSKSRWSASTHVIITGLLNWFIYVTSSTIL